MTKTEKKIEIREKLFWGLITEQEAEDMLGRIEKTVICSRCGKPHTYENISTALLFATNCCN